MSEREEEKADASQARRELRSLADELEAVMNRLMSIHAALPVPPEQALMLVGEADYDVPTELRTAIECVNGDHLGPAIQAIRKAAAYQPP
ncbi:MAG: hypothetical protein ACJ75H_00905 [Thermoanaerobaculia bacterium]